MGPWGPLSRGDTLALGDPLALGNPWALGNPLVLGDPWALGNQALGPVYYKYGSTLVFQESENFFGPNYTISYSRGDLKLHMNMSQGSVFEITLSRETCHFSTLSIIFMIFVWP